MFPFILFLIIYGLNNVLHLQPSLSDLSRAVHLNTIRRIERKIFACLPHQLISDTWHPLLDFVAAVPYLIHYSIPIAFPLYLFWRDRIHDIPRFYLLLGVSCWVTYWVWWLFPHAPPWVYLDLSPLVSPAATDASFEKLIHTVSSADLPQLLAHKEGTAFRRIDEFIGRRFFYSLFTGSPVPYACFPSGHLAWTFTVFVVGAPGGNYFILYVLWMAWSTMYTNHHYLTDVFAGVAFVLICDKLLQLVSRVSFSKATGVQTTACSDSPLSTELPSPSTTTVTTTPLTPTTTSGEIVPLAAVTSSRRASLALSPDFPRLLSKPTNAKRLSSAALVKPSWPWAGINLKLPGNACGATAPSNSGQSTVATSCSSDDLDDGWSDTGPSPPLAPSGSFQDGPPSASLSSYRPQSSQSTSMSVASSFCCDSPDSKTSYSPDTSCKTPYSTQPTCSDAEGVLDRKVTPLEILGRMATRLRPSSHWKIFVNTPNIEEEEQEDLIAGGSNEWEWWNDLRVRDSEVEDSDSRLMFSLGRMSNGSVEGRNFGWSGDSSLVSVQADGESGTERELTGWSEMEEEEETDGWCGSCCSEGESPRRSVDRGAAPVGGKEDTHEECWAREVGVRLRYKESAREVGCDDNIYEETRIDESDRYTAGGCSEKAGSQFAEQQIVAEEEEGEALGSSGQPAGSLANKKSFGKNFHQWLHSSFGLRLKFNSSNSDFTRQTFVKPADAMC